MENNSVPYIVHEGDMSRLERMNRRWFITSIVLLLLLAGSNIAWLMYESSFEDRSTTTIEQEVEQESEGDGDNNFVGGDVIGTTESQN